MAVKAMIESLVLEHGWGAKGRRVELVSADTVSCPRTHSGRQHDPAQPCGFRLRAHPTLRLPEGRPVECHSCGWLGVREHPEADHAAARAAAAEGRVIRVDVTRGLYTLGDLVEWVGKLFPALGLGPVAIELVGPDEATVPYEEPAEAAPPKTEVEELRERLAKLEARAAEQASEPTPKRPKKPATGD